MILQKLPIINYNNLLIRNIITDINSIYTEIAALFVLQSYNIVGYPRPEELARKLYGHSEYEWVLLLVNQIIDPYHDWIKSENQVYETATIMYDDIYATHHHIDPNDNDYIYYDLVYWVGVSPETEGWYHKNDTTHLRLQVQGDLIPVTNVEYELDLNETKRNVVIVPPQKISKFIDTVERLVNDRYNKKY